MSFGLGALFAFGALFFWGYGDFLIQKTTRHIGDWETLFLIVAFGTVILTPFVYQSLLQYLSMSPTLTVLLLTSLIIFVAALVDFEALKKGKIAAIEPALSLEVPVVAFLALIVVNEALQPVQSILVILLIIGLGLVSLRSYHFSKAAWLERGVLLAIVAAFLLGASDFLVGLSARITNPLLINWFIDITLTLYTLVYLVAKGGARRLVRDTKKIPGLVLGMCTFDNFAWISFAFATLFIPITIAVAISENYIGFAALLGLFVNKEKLLTHQKIGLVMALASAVLLALIM